MGSQYAPILKFNPNHDKLGRFGTKGSGVSWSPMDTKLVDYIKDRPLQDKSQTTDIKVMVPNAKVVMFSQTPFFDKMNKAMGSDPATADVKDYLEAKWQFFKKQPVSNISLTKDLVVTQDVVHTKTIESGLKTYKPGSHSASEPIEVVHYGGENYVMNGHHRLVSDILRGNTTIDAKIWNLDKPSQKSEAPMYANVLKFNAHHDNLGRFASVHGGVMFVPKGLKQQARKLAEDLLTKAKESEPTTSQSLQSVVRSPATLVGFDYRLKSAGSLSRKIYNDARFQKKDPVAIAKGIGDAIRYTVQTTPEKYNEDVHNILKRLKQDGHTVLKFKNYWGKTSDGKDPIYQGINMSMKNKEGQVWELQFHTAQSFHTKEVVNHVKYEEYRRFNEDDTKLTPRELAAKESLYRQMAAEQAKVTPPVGASGLRPKHQASALKI